ncbi:MAG: hypothetical protein QOI28_2192, partial [Mycobacterium sp.]|nr:hypothetical protein [Mycobacterium sp.]
HGALLAAAAAGKMPVYIKGTASEVVGVEDAATALLLAAEKGRTGERYIISERFMSARELYEAAAAAGRSAPPRFGIPLSLVYAMGYAGDLAARVLRRDMELSSLSVRLMHVMPPMDHVKAERELGWQPEPIHESIRRAADWYREHRRRRREVA